MFVKNEGAFGGWSKVKREEALGNELREGTGTLMAQDLVKDIVRTLVFILRKMGSHWRV